MTALLAIHAIATPGILVGPNGVIALAGAASLPAGATVLALSALPAMRRPVSLRPVLALQAGLAVAIIGLGRSACSAPAAVPSVPQAGSAPAVVLLVVGAAGFALLALRAARTYTLTRRTTDLLVSVGCVWLGWALVPQLLMGYGTWAFYFGHAMELLGIVLIAIPAVLDLRQGGGLAAARRRPRRHRARRRRGGVPRRARALADGGPRRQGPLHRGAHAPRGDPGLRGR